MDLKKLIDASKYAETMVSNYYAGTSTYQGGKMVAVLDSGIDLSEKTS